MSKNYLLVYSEQLATDIELLCQNIKAHSNTLFQIRKSSSSVYARIRKRLWLDLILHLIGLDIRIATLSERLISLQTDGIPVQAPYQSKTHIYR